MKFFSLRRAGAALALAALSGPVLAGSGWSRYPYHHHRHSHYHGGYYAGGSSDGWWIGGVIALVAAGALIAANSQPAPAVVYSAPPPQYALPPEAYALPQPDAGTPQAAQAASAGGGPLSADPTRGQNQAQQLRDRDECGRQAMNQSGFDPAHVTRWTTSVALDSYNRAIAACMSGRGYRVS